MANKEYVKVPFDRKRFELMLALGAYKVKHVADLSGVSRTTISRAMKNGFINEEFLDKIVTVFPCDKDFLMGDKKLNAVAKAFATVIDYWKSIALETTNE